MNATDILGELIKGGTGGLLKDMLGGGGAKPKPRPIPKSPSPVEDYEMQIEELERSLGVGGSTPAPSPSTQASWNTPRDREIPPPLPKRKPDHSPPPERQDAESLVLIRAMIHAAMADGRLTRSEQDAIVQKIGDRSPEGMRFLEREFQERQSTRDFAWSVPLGMEYKVYAVSLAAIDLDQESESNYLSELAHGLRLPLEVRQHLHQRYGAPSPM